MIPEGNPFIVLNSQLVTFHSIRCSRDSIIENMLATVRAHPGIKGEGGIGAAGAAIAGLAHRSRVLFAKTIIQHVILQWRAVLQCRVAVRCCMLLFGPMPPPIGSLLREK